MARGFHSAPGSSPEVDEASKPHLHQASMAMHGRSKNSLVRQVIAERLDCPFGLMVTLAHDPIGDVRAAVAANPSAAQAVLEHLAEDRDVHVVLAVVGNPGLPQAILEQLVFHKKSEVRDAAAKRLDGVGLSAVPDYEDHATPELRDVGIGGQVANGSTLHAVNEGRYEVAPPGAPEHLTRTAPVRGFKPRDAG